jgi:2-isopropylmalate synthase
MMNYKKYEKPPKFDFKERTWPSKELIKAPVWCSSDLRDGNQALRVPMSLEQKIEFYKFLVKIGFKEIEVAFPAASDTEFEFVRTLIEKDMIPDGVTIQVLTQAREQLIERTFESLKGVKKAIVHLYNSTSPMFRQWVFNKDKQEVKEMAVRSARQFLECAAKYGGERFRFEYSPETFTSTEMDFAADICNAVLDVWKPSADQKAVINLPETVQYSTPNVYADQIEYMCKNLNYRQNVMVSLHSHNDRGTGIAATELALLAGADRVEGTLFGNGERTGNADILVLAMNFYMQGMDPGLDFSNMEQVIRDYVKFTSMPVHPRHPYAGDLVFTAFSGSHQDAIKKGMEITGKNYEKWKMPYLIIDPKDVGRDYEAIIRINSQSGKGGVFYILEHNYGINVPIKEMQREFGNIVTKVSDNGHKELSPAEIYDLFVKTYVEIDSPAALVKFEEKTNGQTSVNAEISIDGIIKNISGKGSGLLEVFCKALSDELGLVFDVKNYSEHALTIGSGSKAVTYIHIADAKGKSYFAAGISSSISKSSVKALLNAVNKMINSGK